MAAQKSGRSAKKKRAKAKGKPRGRPFPKGVSGNPGGRPKTNREIVALAREHSPAAIRRLANIMNGSGPHAVAAARAILDRGYGKPTQAFALSPMDEVPPDQDNSLEGLPDEIIEQLARHHAFRSAGADGGAGSGEGSERVGKTGEE